MTWRRAHRAAAARFSASPSSAGGTAPARCPRTRLSLREAREHQRRATNTLRGACPLGRGPPCGAARLTHVCTSRCNPGGAGVPSWCPPACIWWRRVRRTCRTSCCLCHTPATSESSAPPRQSLVRSPPRASPRLRTYMVVLVHARWALGRLLAHTPGLVVRVEFAHLATFAGKVVARICRGRRPE